MLHRKPWKDTEGTITLNSPLRFKRYEAMEKPELQEQKEEGEDVPSKKKKSDTIVKKTCSCHEAEENRSYRNYRGGGEEWTDGTHKISKY